MRWKDTLMGTVLGALIGLPVLALSYLGWQVSGLPFVPFEAFGYLSRQLPGGVVTAGIDLMVFVLQSLELGSTADLAKRIEMVLAVGLELLLFAAGGAVFGALQLHRRPRAALFGGGLGLVLWLVHLPVGQWAPWDADSFVWLMVLTLGWGVTLGWALRQWTRLGSAETDQARRGFLARLGAGVAAVAAAGLGVGWFYQRGSGEAADSSVDVSAGLAPPPTPVRPPGFQPVPGTRPALTPLPDFYRVDITLMPPSLAAEDWQLEVSGLVDQPLMLTYADLMAMPAENFYATLECISNRIGGDLISTTWFTGIPLRLILERAGLRAEAVDIKFTCQDGYTESLPIASALHPQTRLCLGMGGQPLTDEHGFPARLFTPDRFGMKNPKWITRIEAVPEDYFGYWEQRGWSEPAWVKTTAVIDATEPSTSELEAGGIAYAGARGIQQVEVRLDDGEWVPAELRQPLSGLTWVLWRARLPASPGQHQLTVRAIDGTGDVQTEQRSPPHPDGATGFHSQRVTVSSG